MPAIATVVLTGYLTEHGNIPQWHCSNCAIATIEVEKGSTFPVVLALQVVIETYIAGRWQHCSTL